MLPNFPEFSKLSLEHQKDIDGAISGFPPYSDYTFASLYPWDTQNKLELSNLNGNLVVKFTDYVTNEPFLSFLGTNKVVETVESVFEYLDDGWRSGRVSRRATAVRRLADDAVGRERRTTGPVVSNQSLLPHLKLIPQDNLKDITLPTQFQVTEDPDNFDYIYNIEELTNLRGENYRQKRNEINNFKKKYSAEVKMLDPKSDETWPQMESVLNLWAARQLKKGNDAKNDVAAVKRTLQIASLIKLLVFGFFVNGTLRGYTMVELNEGNYATDLFEHANVSFDGIFPFQRQAVAEKLNQLGYKFLNNQQDLSIAGLKNSKQLWHPAFFLRKYTISATR